MLIWTGILFMFLTLSHNCPTTSVLYSRLDRNRVFSILQRPKVLNQPSHNCLGGQPYNLGRTLVCPRQPSHFHRYCPITGQHPSGSSFRLPQGPWHVSQGITKQEGNYVEARGQGEGHAIKSPWTHDQWHVWKGVSWSRIWRRKREAPFSTYLEKLFQAEAEARMKRGSPLRERDIQMVGGDSGGLKVTQGWSERREERVKGQTEAMPCKASKVKTRSLDQVHVYYWWAIGGGGGGKIMFDFANCLP